MFSPDAVAGFTALAVAVGYFSGSRFGYARYARRCIRLEAIVTRETTTVAEQSQELAGARMELRQQGRLASYWHSPSTPPDEGVEVVVLRDAGFAGNSTHPGHRSGRWLERTVWSQGGFVCDLISTGKVIGWVPANELAGSTK